MPRSGRKRSRVDSQRLQHLQGLFDHPVGERIEVGREGALQRQDVRLALLAIADGLGDAEAYLAEYRTHAPAALGQPERALALLEAVELPEGLGSAGARPWLNAQLEALEAPGRGEEAQALRRRFGLEHLSLAHLRAYLQRLPAFEDAEAEEEVLEHPLFHAALDFLHRWPDQRRAARLIEAQPEQLNGANEPLLSAVAAGLDTRHPLAARLCLRAMGLRLFSVISFQPRCNPVGSERATSTLQGAVQSLRAVSLTWPNAISAPERISSSSLHSLSI